MPVNGKFTDDLGFYNPHTKQIGLDSDKATKWLNNGAKPSNTVAKLLLGEKVKHSSIVVLKKNKKTKQQAEAATKAEAPATASDEQAVTETPEQEQEVEATAEPTETASEPEVSEATPEESTEDSTTA